MGPFELVPDDGGANLLDASAGREKTCTIGVFFGAMLVSDTGFGRRDLG
jgi:hypothetical protein